MVSEMPAEVKRQLLGEDIDEWRCPDCGDVAYTHTSQGALMVKCSGNHPDKLVWMVPNDPASAERIDTE